MKSIFFIPVFFFALVSLSAASTNTANNDNGAKPTFQDFLAQFPKANLPYAFEAEDMQVQLEKRTAAPKAQRLAWEYYHFLPMLEESARHNRMPVYPEAVAAFETNEYFAVLYNTGRAFTKNLKSYHISVYDKDGNHLATHFVAGANAGTITAAVIDETLNADVQAYEVNWAREFRNGANNDGNTVVGLTPAGRRTIALTSGNAVEQLTWAYHHTTEPASTLTADAK
ncbi:MAG: hypothetical protein IPM98_16760 [Lewinellaceae bacterium]|nr:hypothetical protein [Lewinellaceae bacterium]